MNPTASGLARSQSSNPRSANPCSISGRFLLQPAKLCSVRYKRCSRTRRVLAALAGVITPPDTTSHSGQLTASQVHQFHESGYLVLPGFASQQELAQLQQRVGELVAEFDPSTSTSVFSTRNQAHAVKTNTYFLDSASNISFFFEEQAFDEAGQLRHPKERALNKIGHALHDVDPVFRAFSRSPKVQQVVRSLDYQRPLPVQSMYIFKQPSIGGEVVPHQDSTFLYTTPLSCTGLWWALEDATLENGCLWAQPGIHKRGLQRRMLSVDGQISFDKPAPAYDLSGFTPLPCKAGTLVLLHGENIHYSCANTSPISRHSYSMHVVESKHGVEWAADNWAHRRPDVPWEPLY